MSLRNIARVAFAAALILLVGIAAVTYRTTNQLVASEQLVSHTHEVQTELEDLRSDVLSAGYARRGYLLTHDETLMVAFRVAESDIPAKLQHLRGLTSDNPQRKPDLDRLQLLIDRNLQSMEESVAAGRAAGSAAPKHDQVFPGFEAGSQAQSLIQAIEKDEGRLLAERRVRSDQVYRQTIRMLLVAFVVALLLLGAEFFLLSLEFGRHSAPNRSPIATAKC